MTNLVKNVFMIVGAVLLAMLLYVLFFVGDNSALSQACRYIQKPISFSYYMYSYYPNAHSKDGLDNALGADTASYDSVSDLASSDTSNSSDVAMYTTGWR